MFKIQLEEYVDDGAGFKGIVIAKDLECYTNFRERQRLYCKAVKGKIAQNEIFEQYCLDDTAENKNKSAKKITVIVAPVEKMQHSRKFLEKVLKICNDNELKGPVAYIR